MKEVLDKFESLIRRAVAPSLTLFAAWGLLDAAATLAGGGGTAEVAGRFAAAAAWSSRVLPAAETRLFVVVLTIIGLSYLLAGLQQLAYDELLNESFEGRWWPFSTNRSELEALRRGVVARLNEHPDTRRLAATVADWNDHLLYEVIGGIDWRGTRAFVDDAKAIGIAALSITSVALALAVLRDDLAWWLRPVLLIVAVVAFVVGREGVKGRYRARSLRHYVNFLAMPEETIAAVLRTHDAPGRQVAGPSAGRGAAG